jgi:hypothetical protein
MRKKKETFTIKDPTDTEEIDQSYKLHRARKMSNDADMKGEQKEIERLKKEKLKANLIPLKEAQEIFVSVGAQTKLRFNRLIAELPPKLEGLNGLEMIPILREKFDEIFADLYTTFSVKEVDADSITIQKDDEREDEEG